MAKQILEDVNPTRMELLEIRKRLVLAEKGHKLLEEKRDVLVEKFFKIVDQRAMLKKTIDVTVHDAFLSLIQAEMLLGEQRVKDVAALTPDIGEIFIKTDNIMGVTIPLIQKDGIRSSSRPFYGFSETCGALDVASQRFIKALHQLVELAEVEGSLRSLSVEIEKTKRRVNVLENTLIPRLLATIKYIEMQLDEREREDFVRRKHIKAKMEAKKEIRACP